VILINVPLIVMLTVVTGAGAAGGGAAGPGGLLLDKSTCFLQAHIRMQIMTSVVKFFIEKEFT
jgi:hypothetical protein